MDITRKTALVTGRSRGIALMILRGFVEPGHFLKAGVCKLTAEALPGTA